MIQFSAVLVLAASLAAPGPPPKTASPTPRRPTATKTSVAQALPSGAIRAWLSELVKPSAPQPQHGMAGTGRRSLGDTLVVLPGTRDSLRAATVLALRGARPRAALLSSERSPHFDYLRVDFGNARYTVWSDEPGGRATGGRVQVADGDCLLLRTNKESWLVATTLAESLILVVELAAGTRMPALLPRGCFVLSGHTGGELAHLSAPRTRGGLYWLRSRPAMDLPWRETAADSAYRPRLSALVAPSGKSLICAVTPLRGRSDSLRFLWFDSTGIRAARISIRGNLATVAESEAELLRSIRSRHDELDRFWQRTVRAFAVQAVTIGFPVRWPI
jgi:hypothetical protein